jgi:DNA-binding response OmpR family regulator
MVRILIVDDEPAIRMLLAGLLSHEGYHVQTADSGSAAMEICVNQEFDLVITDIVMPGMDGHSLARWLAVKHPSTRIAVMSGFDPGCQGGCPYLPQRCKFLAKPFSPGEMLEFVRNTLVEPGPAAH